jgi:hypothetical protein
MADMFSTLGPLIGVLVTIGFWSYLYKETALFRAVEFTFIGFAAGHATVMAIDGIKSKLYSPIIDQNNYSLLIPLVLGLLLYARYSENTRFLQRFPISVMVGVGTGVSVRAMVKAQLLAQVQQTIQPTEIINGLIIALLTLGTVIYFIFSSEEGLPKSIIPLYGGLRRIGRIAIMAAMGAAFGNLCVTRYTMAISRIIKAVTLILG